MDFSMSKTSTACRKLRRTRKVRPAISADASPSLAMVSRSMGRKNRRICSRSAGAPIVATAATPGNSAAATIAAVPPRLCPTSKEGGIPAAVIAFAAERMSSTSDAKLTGSPDPAPIPAKSNLRTPMPARDSAREM